MQASWSGYPGTPGKATAFAYDGLGRRTAISETPPGGGTAVTTSYLWCGEDICQARDATNARTRSYYDEGEIVPGSPAQPYYYGIDQLGSVRRAFASTSSAPAYAYDPYGVPLQATAPVTDFGYAGMFNHPASGLNLTQYRAYDPVAGRWLSRDPLGEPSDPYGNLYAYVGGNAIGLIDPTGENPFAAAGAAGGAIGGFLGSIGGQLYNSGGDLNCVSLGQALGDAAEGAGLGGTGGLLAGIFRRAAIALAGRGSQWLVAGNPIARRSPDFIVSRSGNAFPVPKGAVGPTPTRAPGMQFTGGSGGGPNLNSRVTGVRFMDANANQGGRAVYMNRSGQTVNPFTGRTVSPSDPTAHFYYAP